MVRPTEQSPDEDQSGSNRFSRNVTAQWTKGTPSMPRLMDAGAPSRPEKTAVYDGGRVRRERPMSERPNIPR